MDYSKKYYLMCEKARKDLLNISDDIWISREVGINGRIGIILKCEFVQKDKFLLTGSLSKKQKLKINICYHSTNYEKG